MTESLEKNNKGEKKTIEITPTPVGELLWKLPGDDDVDIDDIFDCPIIPGTSGVEC